MDKITLSDFYKTLFPTGTLDESGKSDAKKGHIILDCYNGNIFTGNIRIHDKCEIIKSLNGKFTYKTNFIRYCSANPKSDKISGFSVIAIRNAEPKENFPKPTFLLSGKETVLIFALKDDIPYYNIKKFTELKMTLYKLFNVEYNGLTERITVSDKEIFKCGERYSIDELIGFTDKKRSIQSRKSTSQRVYNAFIRSLLSVSSIKLSSLECLIVLADRCGINENKLRNDIKLLQINCFHGIDDSYIENLLKDKDSIIKRYGKMNNQYLRKISGIENTDTLKKQEHEKRPDNKKRVHDYFIQYPDSTQAQCAEALNLSIKTVYNCNRSKYKQKTEIKTNCPECGKYLSYTSIGAKPIEVKVFRFMNNKRQMQTIYKCPYCMCVVNT